MDNNQAVFRIPVTFDKSHLITIGEKLYTESIELVREVVEDDGSGMAEAGIRQYFTIGSTEKKKHGTSPQFNRIRIGEFGIGKFATLSACGHFEVTTRRADFAATVVFDKETWEKGEDLGN